MKKKITDIQIEGQDAFHRVLFLDGERFGRVDAGLITKFGVRIGLEIEEVVLHKLIQADEIMRAKNYAGEFLKDQTYSKGQMFTELERKGFGHNAIDTTLKELEQLGQIRDEKYAQAWIKKRQRSKPKGKKMLRYELIERPSIERSKPLMMMMKPSSLYKLHKSKLCTTNRFLHMWQNAGCITFC